MTKSSNTSENKDQALKPGPHNVAWVVKVDGWQIGAHIHTFDDRESADHMGELLLGITHKISDSIAELSGAHEADVDESTMQQLIDTKVGGN